MPGGEAPAAGALSALAVEGAGDDGIGVMNGRAAHQCDAVLVGANGRGIGVRQADIDLG